MKVTMEEGQNAMLDSVGTQVYGVGTGDDFLGLGAIVDDGTNTSTYGWLDSHHLPSAEQHHCQQRYNELHQHGYQSCAAHQLLVRAANVLASL
jgi:hypothetical protein